MRDHVYRQTAVLLQRFADEVNRAEAGNPDSIHDLRVAIRRLSRCLSVFSQFYPDGAAKRLRRELAELGDAAGAVRDRHIALELVAGSGIAADGPFIARLEDESRKAGRALLREIRRWQTREFSRRWCKKLGLEDNE